MLGITITQEAKPISLGQKKPNGLGIYDMSGNVWEWVNDWYDRNYYKDSPKDNPKGRIQVPVVSGGVVARSSLARACLLVIATSASQDQFRLLRFSVVERNFLPSQVAEIKTTPEPAITPKIC